MLRRPKHSAIEVVAPKEEEEDRWHPLGHGKSPYRFRRAAVKPLRRQMGS